MSKGGETTDNHWYAFYSKSKMERKLEALLHKLGIDAYVPLRKELRQWSDRMKLVEEPLLRNYVFVRISSNRIFDVLAQEGCVSVVSFEGKPAIIPDQQMEDLRKFLMDPRRKVYVSSERIEKGDLVKVCNGPLMGTVGEVAQFRGKRHIVLMIESLGAAVYTELDQDEVTMVSLTARNLVAI